LLTNLHDYPIKNKKPLDYVYFDKKKKKYKVEYIYFSQNYNENNLFCTYSLVIVFMGAICIFQHFLLKIIYIKNNLLNVLVENYLYSE